MVPEKSIDAAAARLGEAARSRRPCEPVRDLIGSNDLSAAYAVQQINTNLRLESGARIVGKKIGLTSPAVQKQLGVDQPDFGVLWHDTEVANGGSISTQQLMQPKAEAEVAFVLGKDLHNDQLTAQDVIAAIDYAVASIEIVGSRIRDWDIKITDTIADNASASHWVVGNQQVPLKNLDLVNCQMTMSNQGSVVSEGVGKACLGSPINAVVWLARKMVEMEQPLNAGDLILSGALGPMVAVNALDQISAHIQGLGRVDVAFED